MVRGLRLKGSVWSLGQREKGKGFTSTKSNICNPNKNTWPRQGWDGRMAYFLLSLSGMNPGHCTYRKDVKNVFYH